MTNCRRVHPSLLPQGSLTINLPPACARLPRPPAPPKERGQMGSCYLRISGRLSQFLNSV